MSSFINNLSSLAEKHNRIALELYQKHNVKRGLRNADGSGVLVGLTEIGDVHGFIFDEGEKIPDQGRLTYRGIKIEDLVAGFQKEKRSGFEEVCYLLLFGDLPVEQQLEDFKSMLAEHRELPNGFTENMILKAPSNDIMNKLARSANKPTLVAWLNYRLSSGFNSESGENEYFVGDSWDHNLTAGVNLSVPVSALFPWSKETADIRSSRIDLANMRINLNSLLSGIKLAVETTILKIAEEEAKIDSGRKSISLAERLYESALEQFDSGYISSKDLKDSQLGLNASRLALAQAIFSYNMNVLDLMDAVGVTGLGDNR